MQLSQRTHNNNSLVEAARRAALERKPVDTKIEFRKHLEEKGRLDFELYRLKPDSHIMHAYSHVYGPLDGHGTRFDSRVECIVCSDKHDQEFNANTATSATVCPVPTRW